MTIQVTYRRTSRMSMRIVKNGDIHVSAPVGMPKREVERFVDEHRDWISKAREKTQQNQQRRAAFYGQLPLQTRAAEGSDRTDGGTPLGGDGSTPLPGQV